MMKNLFFLTVAVALTAVFAGCNKNMDAPEVGVTIAGVTWATRNVDAPGKFANNPQDAGMFYQWNRKKGWPATGTVTGWPTTPASGSVWAAANDPCPTGWHIPTLTDVEKLFAATVTKMFGTYDGVYGVYFGTAPDRIFLPAAGVYDMDGILVHASTDFGYWSCTQNNDSYAYGFVGNEYYGLAVSYGSKTDGLSLRCVK